MRLEVTGTIFKLNFYHFLAVTNLPIGDAVWVSRTDFFDAEL